MESAFLESPVVRGLGRLNALRFNEMPEIKAHIVTVTAVGRALDDLGVGRYTPVHQDREVLVVSLPNPGCIGMRVDTLGTMGLAEVQAFSMGEPFPWALENSIDPSRRIVPTTVKAFTAVIEELNRYGELNAPQPE